MSRTDFNPSTFDKQAAASLDMIDEQAAAERVQRILHPKDINLAGPAKATQLSQAGPTITTAPQTQPQAPAPRKKRSDAGIPKGPKKPAVDRKGFLTVEQVAHLSKLIEEKNHALEANTKAESAMLDACAALEKYLDELTIKK